MWVKSESIEMAHTKKLSPLVGESVNRQVDGRGKCGQTQKIENSMSKIEKYGNDSQKAVPDHGEGGGGAVGRGKRE